MNEDAPQSRLRLGLRLTREVADSALSAGQLRTRLLPAAGEHLPSQRLPRPSQLSAALLLQSQPEMLLGAGLENRPWGNVLELTGPTAEEHGTPGGSGEEGAAEGWEVMDRGCKCRSSALRNQLRVMEE